MEEVRRILNNNKSKGERSSTKAFREVREGKIIRGIWDYKGDNDTEGKIDLGLNTKMEQEIQRYWGKIDGSKIFNLYIKTTNEISNVEHSTRFQKKNNKLFRNFSCIFSLIIITVIHF